LFHEIYPFWAKSDFASHSIVSSARNRILKADLSCLHFSRSFARECRKTGVRFEGGLPSSLHQLGGIGDKRASQPLPFLGAAERC
jgi:hypothetical protein